jgi:ParB family transcriptional regulator, chromosome partitioning protein
VAKSTGLGQGVGLLFGATDIQEKYFECKVEKILPNKFQPRTYFDAIELQELADSIRENGIIQPLIVTRSSEEGMYELVAGERRLRASKMAELTTVPVVVMDIGQEDTLLELALIENIQRTDLNPVEEAEAYQKLILTFGYTQEETAKKVGKNRSTITNMLRLLNLPDLIKQDIITGTLSEGHARALLRLTNDLDLLKRIRDQIVLKQLTVRQTEKLVKKETTPQPKASAQTNRIEHEVPSSYYSALTNQLTNRLGTKVVINQNGSRGRLEIDYYSLDDLERLTSIFLPEQGG